MPHGSDTDIFRAETNQQYPRTGFSKPHVLKTGAGNSVRPDRLTENKIVCADAKDLGRYVKPGSVALTVTSPPYRNAIDYSQDVSNAESGAREWMRGTGRETTAEYLGEMERIFARVFEATREGGFCCIVVGDEVVSGKLIPLPSLLLSRLAGAENEDEPAKWRLRDVIIWHKVTSGRNGAGNRCGSFIKTPYPGYYRANIMHEYILVLQKGPGVLEKTGGRIPANRVVKREIANSIWNIAPVPPSVTEHPVPFPEQIPRRLITLFTKKGDLVLDPMNGSGQTTKAAYATGRRFVGLDIRQQYVREARKRLKLKGGAGGDLVPVYHKEVWSEADQEGFFETREADLSKNIPAGYKPVFATPDREVAGYRGTYTYYKKGSKYMCFIASSGGRHLRLNLGDPKDRGSLLHGALAALPSGEFAVSALKPAKTELASSRQLAKACLDVLEILGYVQESGGKYRKGAALV